MRIIRASTKPSKPPGALYDPPKSSAIPNSLRPSAAKCPFISLACPTALLELIARLGFTKQNFIMACAVNYDHLLRPRCTEQSQIRCSDAQFLENLARLSIHPAVSGIIRPKATRLTLPLECIPRALSGMRKQGEFGISCRFQRCTMIALPK